MKPKDENAAAVLKYTSRCWKLRVFKGSYPDGDRFSYHDLLDCDGICTT